MDRQDRIDTDESLQTVGELPVQSSATNSIKFEPRTAEQQQLLDSVFTAGAKKAEHQIES